MRFQGRSEERVSKRALLTGWFNFATPALLFARLRLYQDRIELWGLHLRGYYRRALEMRQILQVDIDTDSVLVIWLVTGETIRLRVNRPSQWKNTIDSCMTRSNIQY